MTLVHSINEWSKASKCRELSQEAADKLFYASDLHNITQGKKFCQQGCTVIDLCKTYAIAHDERGVWGGTSRRERKQIPDFIVEGIREIYRVSGLLEDRSLPLPVLRQTEPEDLSQPAGTYNKTGSDLPEAC